MANLHHHTANAVSHGNPFGRILSPCPAEAEPTKQDEDEDGGMEGGGACPSPLGLPARGGGTRLESAFDAVAAGSRPSPGKAEGPDSSYVSAGAGASASASASAAKDRGDALWEAFCSRLASGMELDGAYRATPAPRGAGRRRARVRPPPPPPPSSSSSYVAAPGLPSPSPGRGAPTERQRIEIALAMVYAGDPAWHTYSPGHTVFGEVGMVVRGGRFALDPGGGATELASWAGAAPENGPLLGGGGGRGGGGAKIVTALEIAFGSDASSSVRCGTALYFDVPAHEIEAHPVRRLLSIKRQNDRLGRDRSGGPGRLEVYLATAASPPFHLVRPSDEDSMSLTIDILRHRVDVLRVDDAVARNGGFASSEERDLMSCLEVEGMCLRGRFQSLVRHWSAIVWDRCAERPYPTDIDTPVLHVDGIYTPQVGTGTVKQMEERERSSGLWQSFLASLEHIQMPTDDIRREGHALSALGNLGTGEAANDFASMPVLRTSFDESAALAPSSNGTKRCSLEENCHSGKKRCWRDLLLFSQEEGEWERALIFFKSKTDKNKSLGRFDTGERKYRQYDKNRSLGRFDTGERNYQQYARASIVSPRQGAYDSTIY